MRCKSVQRRLTSEDRRLSTHFACLPGRSLRRSRGVGRGSPGLRSAVFSGSSLMDFTGLSVVALLHLGVSYLRIQVGSLPLVFMCLIVWRTAFAVLAVTRGESGWVGCVRYFGIETESTSRQ